MTEKDGEKDDVSRVSCSCMGVEYSPIRNKDGSYTERWACKDCGNQFVKIQFLEELRTRVAELDNAYKQSFITHGEIIKELQNRLSTLEKEVQIDCRDCREGDGSCDKMHMPSGTMKMFIANLQKQCEELVQEAWYFKQASDNLESRLSTLLKASEGMEKALEEIANQDYRGNRPYEATIAFKALADFRDVKEKLIERIGGE